MKRRSYGLLNNVITKEENRNGQSVYLDHVYLAGATDTFIYFVSRFVICMCVVCNRVIRRPWQISEEERQQTGSLSSPRLDKKHTNIYSFCICSGNSSLPWLEAAAWAPPANRRADSCGLEPFQCRSSWNGTSVSCTSSEMIFFFLLYLLDYRGSLTTRYRSARS